MNFLSEHNIIAAFHYPVPCHLQKAYLHLNNKMGDFPNAEYQASNCISLPMYAELLDVEVNAIINIINNY